MQSHMPDWNHWTFLWLLQPALHACGVLPSLAWWWPALECPSKGVKSKMRGGWKFGDWQLRIVEVQEIHDICESETSTSACSSGQCKSGEDINWFRSSWWRYKLITLSDCSTCTSRQHKLGFSFFSFTYVEFLPSSPLSCLFQAVPRTWDI